MSMQQRRDESSNGFILFLIIVVCVMVLSAVVITCGGCAWLRAGQDRVDREVEAAKEKVEDLIRGESGDGEDSKKDEGVSIDTLDLSTITNWDKKRGDYSGCAGFPVAYQLKSASVHGSTIMFDPPVPRDWPSVMQDCNAAILLAWPHDGMLCVFTEWAKPGQSAQAWSKMTQRYRPHDGHDKWMWSDGLPDVPGTGPVYLWFVNMRKGERSSVVLVGR